MTIGSANSPTKNIRRSFPGVPGPDHLHRDYLRITTANPNN